MRKATENQRLKERKERYYQKVKSMIAENQFRCFELTFTFTNETLQKTSDKTRLRYIKDFLNKQAKFYLLNKDYGEKNGREHYHAFILSRYKIINFDAYKLGLLKAHHYFNSKNIDSAEQITKHAFKDTTKKAKIIYSRVNKDKQRDIDFERQIKERQERYKIEHREITKNRQERKVFQEIDELHELLGID